MYKPFVIPPSTNVDNSYSSNLQVNYITDGTANMTNGVLSNLAYPTAPDNAASLQYLLDAIANGPQTTASSWKIPVVATSTPTSIINNMNPPEMLFPIDDVVIAAGDRVLLKNQLFPVYNGIWIANAGPGPWTRSFDAAATLSATGNIAYCESGTENGNRTFVCITYPAIYGTDDLTFVQTLIIEPSGNIGDVQYNENNVLGGASSMIWNTTNNNLSLINVETNNIISNNTANNVYLFTDNQADISMGTVFSLVSLNLFGFGGNIAIDKTSSVNAGNINFRSSNILGQNNNILIQANTAGNIFFNPGISSNLPDANSGYIAMPTFQSSMSLTTGSLIVNNGNIETNAIYASKLKVYSTETSLSYTSGAMVIAGNMNILNNNTFFSTYISDLALPNNNTDLANKLYVDTNIRNATKYVIGGTTTCVQYNAGGTTLGGSTSFTFDGTSLNLVQNAMITGNISAANITAQNLSVLQGTIPSIFISDYLIAQYGTVSSYIVATNASISNLALFASATTQNLVTTNASILNFAVLTETTRSLLSTSNLNIVNFNNHINATITSLNNNNLLNNSGNFYLSTMSTLLNLDVETDATCSNILAVSNTTVNLNATTFFTTNLVSGNNTANSLLITNALYAHYANFNNTDITDATMYNLTATNSTLANTANNDNSGNLFYSCRDLFSNYNISTNTMLTFATTTNLSMTNLTTPNLSIIDTTTYPMLFVNNNISNINSAAMSYATITNMNALNSTFVNLITNDITVDSANITNLNNATDITAVNLVVENDMLNINTVIISNATFCNLISTYATISQLISNLTAVYATYVNLTISGSVTAFNTESMNCSIINLFFNDFYNSNLNIENIIVDSVDVPTNIVSTPYIYSTNGYLSSLSTNYIAGYISTSNNLVINNDFTIIENDLVYSSTVILNNNIINATNFIIANTCTALNNLYVDYALVNSFVASNITSSYLTFTFATGDNLTASTLLTNDLFIVGTDSSMTTEIIGNSINMVPNLGTAFNMNFLNTATTTSLILQDLVTYNDLYSNNVIVLGTSNFTILTSTNFTLIDTFFANNITADIALSATDLTCSNLNFTYCTIDTLHIHNSLPSTYALTVTGDVDSDNNIYAISYNIVSDKNLKHDIKKFKNNNNSAIDIISKLKPYLYSYINDDNSRHYGLIAQDVEQQNELRDLVLDNNNYKKVNYVDLIPIMIEAIKELAITKKSIS